MAALEDTEGYAGQGVIDPNQDFIGWLKSLKASDALINKMKEFDMDSMYIVHACIILKIVNFMLKKAS